MSRWPFAAYTHKPGEVLGNHWYIPNVRRTAQFAHVLVDTNYWKSFVHSGLATAMSDRGCISLYGTPRTNHSLFAEHVARPDNHWLDCLVGCAVAASMLGVRVPGQDAKPVRKRKRYTQKDLRRR